MALQALAMQLRSETGLQTLQLFRRWDRIVTVPAMLLTWVTGLFLATQGAWFGDRWLFMKLAIVVLLSGIHGVLAGRLRAGLQNELRPPGYTLLPAALLVMIASIVLLVIVKPF